MTAKKQILRYIIKQFYTQSVILLSQIVNFQITILDFLITRILPAFSLIRHIQLFFLALQFVLDPQMIFLFQSYVEGETMRNLDLVILSSQHFKVYYWIWTPVDISARNKCSIFLHQFTTIAVTLFDLRFPWRWICWKDRN